MSSEINRNIELLTKSSDKPSAKPRKETFIIDENGDLHFLHYDTVKKYIGAICKKMYITHLDVDKITNNVYPKLKTKNTIDDVDEQIIMSASEMVTDHYDYPRIA